MTSLRREMSELPELEGWITLPEAAEALGVTRARSYQLVQEGKITTVHRLGKRPIYVVRTAEIEQIRVGRAEEPPVQLPVAPGSSFLVGGTKQVVVARGELEQALVLLRATAGTHGSFKQAMLKHANPLSQSDYMGTARSWRAAHPGQARGLSTKQVLIKAYEDLLDVSLEPLQAAG